MYGYNKVLQHSYLSPHRREKALPMTEEAHLNQLSYKQFVDQTLNQLENNASDKCGHCLRKDNVPTMLVAAFTNRDLFSYKPMALLMCVCVFVCVCWGGGGGGGGGGK